MEPEVDPDNAKMEEEDIDDPNIAVMEDAEEKKKEFKIKGPRIKESRGQAIKPTILNFPPVRVALKRLKVYRCLDCNFTTQINNVYRHHCKSLHGRIMDFSCDECDYTTHERSNFKTHVKAIHAKIRDLKCNLCGFTASHKGNLKKHVQCVHEKDRRFACKECNFSSPYNNAPKGHVKSVHQKIKDFGCDRCGKKFPSGANLKTHINTVHLKMRDFKCGECSFAAATLWNLRKHIRVVHEKVKEFQCEECDYRTGSKHNLWMHIRSKHPMSASKEFTCTKCDYKTIHKKSLQLHVKAVHDKVRDILCKSCDFKTVSVSALRAHINFVHEKIRPFSCDKCDYASAYRKDVRKHADSAHNELTWRGGKSLRPNRRLKNVKREKEVGLKEERIDVNEGELKPEEECKDSTDGDEDEDEKSLSIVLKDIKEEKKESNLKTIKRHVQKSTKQRSKGQRSRPVLKIIEKEEERFDDESNDVDHEAKTEETSKDRMDEAVGDDNVIETKHDLEDMKTDLKGIDNASSPTLEATKKEKKGLKKKVRKTDIDRRLKPNVLKRPRSSARAQVHIKADWNIDLNDALKGVSHSVKKEDKGVVLPTMAECEAWNQGLNGQQSVDLEQQNVEVEGKDPLNIEATAMPNADGEHSSSGTADFSREDRTELEEYGKLLKLDAAEEAARTNETKMKMGNEDNTKKIKSQPEYVSILIKPSKGATRKEENNKPRSLFIQDAIKAQVDSFSGQASDIEIIQMMIKNLQSYIAYLKEKMKNEDEAEEGEERACRACDFSTASERHLSDHVEAHLAMASMSDGGQQRI